MINLEDQVDFILLKNWKENCINMFDLTKSDNAFLCLNIYDIYMAKVLIVRDKTKYYKYLKLCYMDDLLFP